LILIAPVKAASVSARARPAGLLKVARAVWLPGIGSALSSVGYGAVLAFSSLLATERGWNPVWLPFTTYAVALVFARLFFGDLPDRLGGAKVALVCILIEAAGLGVLGLAQDGSVAALGAAITGFGYSLIYPGLGAEAVSRAPRESQGLAIGAYTVFLDLALGLGSPALGFIADWTNLRSGFLVASMTVACSAAIAVHLHVAQRPQAIGPHPSS
jgi:MFS family permease